VLPTAPVSGHLVHIVESYWLPFLRVCVAVQEITQGTGSCAPTIQQSLTECLRTLGKHGDQRNCAPDLPASMHRFAVDSRDSSKRNCTYASSTMGRELQRLQRGFVYMHSSVQTVA
jgi:hypothetical protein